MDLFESLTTLQRLFLGMGVGGTIFMAIKFGLMFLGADVGEDGLGEGMDGADSSFQFLSISALGSFVMMFGIFGLAASYEFKMGTVASLLFGTGAGLLMVFVYSSIMKNMAKLESSGNISINDTVGCPGSVYLTIGEEDPGIVNVSVKGERVEFKARSVDGVGIPNNAEVKVVEVQGDIIVVEKVN